jgi:hypothetical protein
MTRAQAVPAPRGRVPKGYSLHEGGERKAPPTVKVGGTIVSSTPYPADSSWLPEVQRIWNSLEDSGMAQLYTASDWATGWVILSALNTALTTVNPTTGMLNGSLVTALISDLGRLGVTAADRQRLRIVVQGSTVTGVSPNLLHLLPGGMA